MSPYCGAPGNTSRVPRSQNRSQLYRKWRGSSNQRRLLLSLHIAKPSGSKLACVPGKHLTSAVRSSSHWRACPATLLDGRFAAYAVEYAKVLWRAARNRTQPSWAVVARYVHAAGGFRCLSQPAKANSRNPERYRSPNHPTKQSPSRQRPVQSANRAISQSVSKSIHPHPP